MTSFKIRFRAIESDFLYWLENGCSDDPNPKWQIRIDNTRTEPVFSWRDEHGPALNRPEFPVSEGLFRDVLSGNPKVYKALGEEATRCILGFHAQQWRLWGRDAYEEYVRSPIKSMSSIMSAYSEPHGDGTYFHRRRLQYTLTRNPHKKLHHTDGYRYLIVEQIEDFLNWLPASPRPVTLPLKECEVYCLLHMMSPEIAPQVKEILDMRRDSLLAKAGEAMEYAPDVRVRLRVKKGDVPNANGDFFVPGDFVPSLVQTPADLTAGHSSQLTETTHPPRARRSHGDRDKVSQSLAAVEVAWDVESRLLSDTVRAALWDADRLQGPARGDHAAALSAVVEEATRTLRDLLNEIKAKLPIPPAEPEKDSPDTETYTDHPLAEVNWKRVWAESEKNPDAKVLVLDSLPTRGGTLYEAAITCSGFKTKGARGVSGNAVVEGNARVSHNARVYGSAQVHGSAIVEGYAEVYGSAIVHGSAIVTDYAQVSGKARIGGDAVILGGKWDGSEGEILSGRWIAPGVPAEEAE